MSLMSFSAFHDHVRDVFSANTDSWSVSASAETESGKIKVCPYASNGDGIGASATYELKDLFLSASLDINSKGDVTPSVAYNKDERSITVDYKDYSIEYAYAVAAYKYSVKTDAIDGWASKLKAAGVFSEVYQAGFQLAYDPFRSGLKSLEYGVIATNPSWMKKAVVSASVKSPSDITAALSYAVKDNTKLHIIADGKGATAGASLASPCGATVAAFINCQRELGFTAKRLLGGWSITAAAVFDIKECCTCPKVGISFSQE